MPITCPTLGHTFDTPAARIATVGICPICGASYAVNPDDTIRRATAADTVPLSEADRDTLRKARPFDRRGRARR
jgi:predicted amidohydrolase